jgi:outer membrane protein OmpA-like peptidoglycan-associated protein
VLGKIQGSKKGSENILLTNKDGKTVQKVQSKNGYFAYTNLKPDDYQIKFENKDPNLRMEIKTVEDDSQMKVEAEDFSKYPYKKIEKDPFNNLVQGRIKDVNANQYSNTDHTVLLVNDQNEVVAKTMANKKGYFAFTRTKQDNYTAVVESPDNTLKAELKVADNDPTLRLTAQQLKAYHYIALNQNLVDGTIVTGKGTIQSEKKPLQDESILLVDSKGEIKQTQTNQQGYFAFKNLRNDDYQVLLENPNASAKIEVQPVADMSQLIVSKDDLLKYNYNKLKGEEISNNIVAGNLQLTDHLKPSETLEILLLNEEGRVMGATKTDTKGRFAFTKLKPDNYKAVVNNPEARLHAHIHAPVNDPALVLDAKELLHYNPSSDKYETLKSSDKLYLNGQIGEVNSSKPFGDQSVFLIDSAGKVSEVSQTDKNGNFEFKDKEVANYQVLFEGKEDQSYQSHLQVFKSPSEPIGKGKKLETVYFKPGSAEIIHKDSNLVTQLAQHLHATTLQGEVRLRVFASNSDKNKDIPALNKKRAEEIKAALVAQGVPAERIKIEDMGVPLMQKAKLENAITDGKVEVFMNE